MAGYINTLQDTVNEHIKDKEAVVESIKEYKTYLLSPKFWDDTTVQTSDVLRFLNMLQIHVGAIGEPVGKDC